ncbi:MAG TPA: rhodanese-like domain-containing protein [Rubrobacteraceae bacterium]|nr:rhodanese-like domain-containing protein [Rubrobacteraceae bacterium]
MSESPPETLAQMVAHAKQHVRALPAERVAAEIEAGDAILIDVREEDERLLEGAIPNALHVPRGRLELSADPASPFYRQEFDMVHRLILYCSLGNRSALGAYTLQRMGYEDVAYLDGGMMEWKRDGRPVEVTSFG